MGVLQTSLVMLPVFVRLQASLPNFKATVAVELWIINFVCLVFCFPQCLSIILFSL
jgi:hypothetical protein